MPPQRRAEPAADQVPAEPHDHRGWRDDPPGEPEAAAGERHRRVAAGKRVGVAPPPVPGEAVPPVLLRVRRRAVQTQAYAPEARLAVRPGCQHNRMPVLPEAGHDLGGAERAEDPSRAPERGPQPQVDPGIPRRMLRPSAEPRGMSPAPTPKRLGSAAAGATSA
jgi:hypothetical protein